METIIGRLQTPADDDGIRKDVHLMTDGDAVTVEADGRTLTLQERLDEIGSGAVVSPDQPDRACVWYEIKSTDPTE